MTSETKIIYHVDDEQTPYLVKLPLSSEHVTLGDFKVALNRPNFKYFFKSVDDDFGVVKEEISDDSAKLPSFNGCVESWLVTADGSSHSDTTVQTVQQDRLSLSPRHPHRSNGAIDCRPPSFHGVRNGSHEQLEHSGCSSETESTLSGLPKFPRHGTKLDRRSFRPQYHDRVHLPKHLRGGLVDGNTAMTSDLDSSSFMDSEDDQASRISTSTDITSVSRQNFRRRRKRRMPRAPMSRTSSVTSITESSMSLNIITVSLNMDTANFLGISIVGHSNQLGGDGGIYVGSIMKGGAVALDGRIEPGDMILQVNDASFENMSNDDAVRVLRAAVQKPGPIKLIVAKCWDPNPKGYFTIPRTEPVRPIDPGAWVAHTNALRAAEMPLDYPRPPSVNTVSSNNSGSFANPASANAGECEKYIEDFKLDVSVHDIGTIVRVMARPESGLEVRDRTWLKITIPNAFLGSDVVEWLYNNVQGFCDRREARKYASRMLKEGYIKHTVNKITFAEQCYYVFGDLCSNFAAIRLEPTREERAPTDHEDVGPLPPPPSITPSMWPPSGVHPTYAHPACPPSFIPSSMASGYVPMPYQFGNEAGSFQNLMPGAGSVAGRTDGASGTGSGGSNVSSESDRVRKSNTSGVGQLIVNNANCTAGGMIEAPTTTSQSDYGGGSGVSGAGMVMDAHAKPTALQCPVSRSLNDVQSDVSSRQSFRMAMGNPCEFFVDVM